MVQINTQNREIILKLVYYGPGLSGKTTNLQKLHELVNQIQYTELFSINTMEDRTLFFDLMPFEVEALNRKIKFQIYTVPGQVHYDSTRRIILAGADGVVFVADSQSDKLNENIQSLNNLHVNLRANRLDIKTIPLVFQYNKRDLPNITSVEILDKKLKFRNVPTINAIAIKGKGVLETFEAIAIDILTHFVKKHNFLPEQELDSTLKKIKEQVYQLKKLTSKASDSENKKTKIVYEGANGQISEDEILKTALESQDKTAKLLTETKLLKDRLEKKNKQMEKLLKENEYMKKFLESLFKNAGVPIITFNLQGKITNWNNSAEKLFMYSVAEAKNMPFVQLVPRDKLLDIQSVLKKVVKSKTTETVEITFKDRENREFRAKTTFSPITIDNNSKTVAIAIIIFPES